MQELLDHAFLRPTEAPGGPLPGQVGLTRDQLKKLLTQVLLLRGCPAVFVTPIWLCSLCFSCLSVCICALQLLLLCKVALVALKKVPHCK